MDIRHNIMKSLAAALVALPAVGFADSGLYIGAGVGSASLAEDIAGIDFDDDASAWRVLGGLQLGGLFGLEAGYQDLGDFEERLELGGTTAVSRFSADGWTLGGALSLPLGEAVSLFGRGGVFVWDADVDVYGVRSALDNDSNPYYGAGGKVAATRNLSLVGDWTRFEFEDAKTDVFSIGFEYRFGN
jgi:hypothetical protein